MICSIDRRASEVGAALMGAGGSAVDAAIAANAVLAVIAPYACGMGGDLFSLVHTSDGPPACLNASGRSGSLSDADELRAAGHETVPRVVHPAAVTVPGCVDGWLELHARFGRMPLAEVLRPALHLAEDGFAAGFDLAARAADVAGVDGNVDIPPGLEPGETVRRPGSARALTAILDSGRTGFYEGEFGAGLLGTCPQITSTDLASIQADWIEPLREGVWEHDVWTVPPNSQGYITLAAASLLQGLPLPIEPQEGLWAHLTVEASRQAGWDRPAVLHESADVAELLDPSRLDRRRRAIDTARAARLPDSYDGGGTMYLCVVDDDGSAVSLIQSNAQGFGARLVAGRSGIFLHNRGLGFSLEAGHPAEYGPRRRPPHTLAPALVTRPDGTLRAVLGTMGGDAQPQIVLQLLARLLAAAQSPSEAVAASRWVLAPAAGHEGFDTWSAAGQVRVLLEPGTPRSWSEGLAARGHVVDVVESNYGHAHMIEVTAAGEVRGAADPRAPESAAI